MKIYRMHRAVRAAADYSGAMQAGGRWNPIGTPMLYTAQHLSLACPEILVHLDKSELPRDYVWSQTDLPRNPERLHFDDLNHVSSCQGPGHSWVRTAGELAVQVPSVVIPAESNFLLKRTPGIFNACLGRAAPVSIRSPTLLIRAPDFVEAGSPFSSATSGWCNVRSTSFSSGG